MATEKILEEKALTLSEAQEFLDAAQQRDQEEELSFVGKKAKEYLQAFVAITPKQRQELIAKIEALDNKRLRDEHIAKIVDFLPKTADDLKVVLQAYPLSLPKKDQDALIAAVKDVVGK